MVAGMVTISLTGTLTSTRRIASMAGILPSHNLLSLVIGTWLTVFAWALSRA